MPKGVRGAGFVVWQLASKLMFSQHPCCQHSPKLKNSPRSSQGTVQYCEILCKSQSGLLRSVLSQIQIDQIENSFIQPIQETGSLLQPPPGGRSGDSSGAPGNAWCCHNSADGVCECVGKCFAMLCHRVPHGCRIQIEKNRICCCVILQKDLVVFSYHFPY